MISGSNYVAYCHRKCIYIFNAKCPHANGDLRQATYEGIYIKCPSHGLRFNLSTGEVDTNEITDDFKKSIISRGIDSYTLKLITYEKINGMIYVDMD